jgi:DNA replication protein DnaC
MTHDHSDGPDDLDREMRAEQARVWQQARLDRFLDRRPQKLARPGVINDVDERAKVAEWADRVLAGEDSGTLVIVGNVGTGKSWTLWHIGEALLRGGYVGYIEVTGAWDFKLLATPPVDADALRDLARADMLMLDDEGAVRISDWDVDHLYGILNQRWENSRPTVITLNPEDQNPGDKRSILERLLGARIASRVADNITMVRLTGDDRRRA